MDSWVTTVNLCLFQAILTYIFMDFTMNLLFVFQLKKPTAWLYIIQYAVLRVITPMYKIRVKYEFSTVSPVNG